LRDSGVTRGTRGPGSRVAERINKRHFELPDLSKPAGWR
jgi:hypothetical protein